MQLFLRQSGVVVLLLFLSIVGPVGAADAADTQSDSAVAELTAMLHDFLANSQTEAAHVKFWAEELVYTSSNGTRFGKVEILQSFAEPDQGDDSGPAVVYSGEDIKVQLFGTTAVVTFRLVGTPDDGSAPSEYFNTGTFLRRDGEWRVIAWQATAIPG